MQTTQVHTDNNNVDGNPCSSFVTAAAGFCCAYSLSAVLTVLTAWVFGRAFSPGGVVLRKELALVQVAGLLSVLARVDPCHLPGERVRRIPVTAWCQNTAAPTAACRAGVVGLAFVLQWLALRAWNKNVLPALRRLRRRA